MIPFTKITFILVSLMIGLSSLSVLAHPFHQDNPWSGSLPKTVILQPQAPGR